MVFGAAKGLCPMQRSSVVDEVYDEETEQGARPTGAPAGTSEVGDLWRILWCRRAIILSVAAVCSLMALLYVMAVPAQFTATAQILIDPRDRQIVTKDVNPDTLASDGGVLQVESQARVIESDAVLLRAIRALHLENETDYGLQKDGLVPRLLDVLRGSRESVGPAAAEERALRALRKNLAVKRAEKVFVIDIVVTASSGTKAAGIADAIAEAYLADQIQSRSESSTRASEALSSHLADLKAGVKAAADAVEHYKATHDLLGTDKQLISDQQLSENGTQLNSTRARKAELQARVDQLDALRRNDADGGAMQEAIQSPVITQLRSSLADLTRRRSDMRTRFGDRYPDLIAIDAEIRQARTLIAAELERLVRSAHSDLERATKNERALAAAQSALKLQTIAHDQAFVALDELTRELDARRSVYKAFLARAGETREQSNIDNTNTRIISRAIPPVQPSWPPRAILLAGAVTVGIGIGAALAFLLEHLAPTILSATQLQAAAHAPVVGVVRGRLRSSKGARRMRRPAGRVPRGDMTLVLALGRLCGPLNALKHKAKPHTILVASARSMARKGRALAEWFASAAAASDLSVLLVEADPGGEGRDPQSLGFLNVLNGECTLRETMIQGETAGVYRLDLGTPTAEQRDLLSDNRLKQFLKLVERKFDLVIFIGGSFVENPRAPPLADCVDDVLFVALRGRTPQREAAETADAVAVSTGRPLSAALLVDHLDRV